MEVASSRPYALYTLGHIYVKEANPAHAETSFSEGINNARMNEDPFIEAYLQRSLGALHRDNGRPEESATCFTHALELFKRMGLQHEVEETEKSMTAGKETSPSN
jgi:tetratricopeptide (TPR) repeat protein